MTRDALVIGAGPAGLATAALLRRGGMAVRLVDREARVGGAYARLDGTLLMTSPARLTLLPDGPPTGTLPAYFTASEYLAYLTAYAARHAVVPERATIEEVRASGPGYLARVRGAEPITTEIVVVASGVHDWPHRPVFAGTPAVPVVHAAQWVTETHARAGSRVLIVGGATSAVEIAEHCARRGCITTLATRKLALGPQTILGFDPANLVLPLLARLRPRGFCAGDTVPAGDRGFAALRDRGAIAVHREPISIAGRTATLADGHRCEIDLVVLATGYRHAAPFLGAEVARTPRGIVRCRRNESVSHRNLFVVGAPCSRSAASQYLYGIARDAEAVAKTIVERTRQRS